MEDLVVVLVVALKVYLVFQQQLLYLLLHCYLEIMEMELELDQHHLRDIVMQFDFQLV
jgi:hypothetical protein